MQVCDEPHPLLIKEMLTHCVNAKIDEAYQILKTLWDKGYSPHDIITNIFRVCKNHSIPEYLKLEFIKVYKGSVCTCVWCVCVCVCVCGGGGGGGGQMRKLFK